MATQIIVLKPKAKAVLQKVVFKAINDLETHSPVGSLNADDLDTLHSIYSDIVSSQPS